MSTSCERDGHDYEFLGRREYTGSRSGGWVDEFFCRKCLDRSMRPEPADVTRWHTERRR